MNDEQMIRDAPTVCAWCDKERGVKRPAGTSHGICREHAAVFESQLEIAKKSGER